MKQIGSSELLQPSSGFYAVGARFVCPRCLRRQLSSRCPHCEGESDALRDLAAGSPAEVLADWSALPAFSRATGPFDPRVVFRVRSLRRFWWLGVILIGLGSIVSAIVGERLVQKAMDGTWSAQAWGTLIGVVLAAVVIGPVLWGLAVWAYSLAARAVARVRYRVTAAVPGLRKMIEGAAGLVLARRKIGAVNTMFKWFERKLAPELRVEPVAAYRAEEAFSAEAFLAEPLDLSLIWDAGGWLELRDGGPFTVAVESMDQDRVRLCCDSGLLLLDPSRGTTTAPVQDLPDWLVALTTRRTQVAGVRFETGTLLRVEGGRWEEDARGKTLRGSAEQPLVIRILNDE